MGKFDLDQLRRTPAYPFVEAAHYLNMPASTLRAWCLGQDYLDRVGNSRRFQPLIRLDGEPREGLSFLNLVEGHVLAAIRRKYEISLPKARRAVQFVKNWLNVQRPLVDMSFQTNGVDLFVEEIGRLVNVTRDGQTEIGEFLRAHLHRIERDLAGVPIKLYPFTRTQAFNAPTPVEIDPTVAFGRPVVRGRAVPTAVLADRFKAGESINVLASDLEIPPETVEDALRCELERAAA
ncbi:MAG: DUF433 domain-containing protein [Steroidobacteraceae bacterium]